MKYNIELDIATAPSGKAAKWQNKRTTWADLADMVKETVRTKETYQKYLSYTKDRQGEIKDVGGFVGGYLRDGRRLKGHVEYRQVITLDVDFGGMEPWEVFTLLNLAGLMYTTHKHSPGSPRYRIVIPLSRRVTPEEYEAIARIIASWLGIDYFDDTTYQPNRLMYWPSTAKDAEYLYDVIDAPILNPDDVLCTIPNWKDPTTWPVSSRVKEIVRTNRSEKAEDPLEKEGIIGAFCRAYTIEEAIAEFLNEVYTPCEELGLGRYTYANGSTSGGLVVYDNKFAYSHHSTDIAGEKLLNAFDLVRLHKFGDLDSKSKDNTDVVKLPSYKAMIDFAGKLSPVKKEVVRERRNNSADVYDELEEEARKTATADEWVGSLDTDAKGNIKSTIDNAVLIINNDENLKGRIRLDEHSLWENAVKAFTWDKPGVRYPRPITDTDLSQIRRYLEKCYNVKGKDTVMAALDIAAQENGYHPIKDYLNALDWDGVERLDTLFIDLFGANDNAYTRAVTRKALCAAVARIYEPGRKFDYMVVLIGGQGIGKSTLLSRLGMSWFTDNVKITNDDRNNLEIMRGKWIIEIAEMRGFNKTEAEFSKQFLSRTEDVYRRVFKTRDVVHPRQSIFIGTHNKPDFLHDESGNRRYWPVNLIGRKGTIDPWEYLTPSTVAQIWAEAKYRVEKGEPLYLDREIETYARQMQVEHLETDAWENDVYTFIMDKTEVTTTEIWEMGVQGNRPIARIEQNRIAKIMRNFGWEQKTVSRNNIKIRAWVVQE